MLTKTISPTMNRIRVPDMRAYDMALAGERIAKARKQRYIKDENGKVHRMTGHDLAKAIGVRNVHLSYIENGHRRMSLDLLLSIADVLDVAVGYILGETDNPQADADQAYSSEEAAAAAQLVDAAPPAERTRMLAVLHVLAEQAPSAEQAEPAGEVNAHGEVELSNFTKRLVLRDRSVQSKPAHHTQR